MAKVVTAPERVTPFQPNRLFLAGSIDMGKAVDWQTDVIKFFQDEDITIYNPRRPDWEASWVQDDTNEELVRQIDWELDHLEDANFILFVFDPNGPAPVTLLELGLIAGDPYGKTVLVVCPPGYWRRGNVQVVCKRSGIIMIDDLDEACRYIQDRLY